MNNEITNRQDIIDTRDIEARIDELTASIEAATDDGDKVDPDEQAELDTLKALKAQAEPYCDDWNYGATLIRESYFQDYAKQLADDCGMVPDDAAWPLTCIDWEQAAEELKQDYTSVEFDGETYYIR